MDSEQDKHPAEYLSLLRLWRVSVEGAAVWRVSLQRPGTAEVVGFADLDAVVTFIRVETEWGRGSECG